MRRIKESFLRFMSGRNGMDYFGYCLWWMYLILFLAQVIVGFFSATARFVLSILLWVLFFYMVFRMFSRNIAARSKENMRWSRIWSKTPFGRKNAARFGGFGFGNRNAYGGYEYKDYTKAAPTPKKKKVKLPKDKDHVYRVCPMCLANLRLLKKKGVHQVRCPKCQNLFEVKI